MLFLPLQLIAALCAATTLHSTCLVWPPGVDARCCTCPICCAHLPACLPAWLPASLSIHHACVLKGGGWCGLWTAAGSGPLSPPHCILRSSAVVRVCCTPGTLLLLRTRARALYMATGMRARVSQIRWLLQQGASTVSPSARSRQPTSDLPQSPPSPPHHPA
jgi:hypothetical protein